MALEDFDEHFNCVTEIPGRTPGLESLADGEYVFRIVSVGEKVVTMADRKTDLITWVYAIESGPGPAGIQVEEPVWLNEQKRANQLGSVLVTLGVPANHWREQGIKFSVGFRAAVPGLVGVRFKAKKTANASKTSSKIYQNLEILTIMGVGTAPPSSYDLPF